MSEREQVEAARRLCDCGHRQEKHYKGRGMCESSRGSGFMCSCSRFKLPKNTISASRLPAPVSQPVATQANPPKPIDTAPVEAIPQWFEDKLRERLAEQGLDLDDYQPKSESPQAEPSESAGIKIRTVAWQDAVAGLEGIFADLQSPDRFHDQWDWMKAGFYLDILKSEIEDSQPSTLPQSSPQAQGFERLDEVAREFENFIALVAEFELYRDKDVERLSELSKSLNQWIEDRQRFGKKEQ